MLSQQYHWAFSPKKHVYRTVLGLFLLSWLLLIFYGLSYKVALADSEVPDYTNLSPRYQGGFDLNPAGPGDLDLSNKVANSKQTTEESVTDCANFSGSPDSVAQVRSVEENPNCAEQLVQKMMQQPSTYLDAFYTLIQSETASDALWWAVFQQVRDDEFRFSASIVEDMYDNLADAITRCTKADSCEQWRKFILPALEYGELYQCPKIEGLEKAAILDVVLYGDFYCIETLAGQLGEVATFRDVGRLIDIAKNASIPWARRNAIRLIGRLAERPESDAIHILVSQMLAGRIVDLMQDRIAHDPSEDVLLDVLWILDTFYHPTFEVQPELERLSQNDQVSPELRFRAMASITRLIQEKERLKTEDLLFLQGSLKSSDPWVRGYAAFALESLQPLAINPAQERQIIVILEDAYLSESEFSTKAAIAQALDSYKDSELLPKLKTIFERDNLAHSLSDGHIAVRSGLSPDEIPSKIARMKGVEQAFFDIFGQAFRAPTPESQDASLELVLFSTQSDYQQYMDAFIGYGADAGGLYLETENSLYTYQRTSNDSRFTVEHLIQHEFTHYLLGRYVFPGLWSDPDYHEVPKGWIDEGTAEYFAELAFGDVGTYSSAHSTERLLYICDGIGNQSLSGLLTQRAGYDEPGTFSYDLAWSFMSYLIENRELNAANLLKSFRNKTYRLADVATIVGFSSIEAMEAEWRLTLGEECADVARNTGGPTATVPLDQLRDPTLLNPSGPKRYDEPGVDYLGTLVHEIINANDGEETAAKFGGRQLGAPSPPLRSGTEVGGERIIRLINGK